MLKTLKNKKGFTLVELLIVIAIIGILSSIVLISINSARNKAKDTAIKGALDQERLNGEMRYSVDDSYQNACSITIGDWARISANISSNGGTPTCNVSDSPYTSYAAQSTLISGGYYCVDSAGFSGSRTTDLEAGTICPTS